jgi:hypothetical protein
VINDCSRFSRLVRKLFLLHLASAVRSLAGDWNSKLSIRMVAGYSELIGSEQFLVAEARYVPNTQFLSIPFRSELIHSAS